MYDTSVLVTRLKIPKELLEVEKCKRRIAEKLLKRATAALSFFASTFPEYQFLLPRGS